MTTLSPTLNGRGAFSVCSEVLPQRLKESSNTHDFRTLRPPFKRWFFFCVKFERTYQYMILEQELIKSLKRYDVIGTWKNTTYLDILNDCPIDFLYQKEKISVIDAFANSFDENPYKDLQGKYAKFSKKLESILLGGSDAPNYIDENTMLTVIKKFLSFCKDKECLYHIKKVPIMVWAVSTQRLNFVEKVLELINSHPYAYLLDIKMRVNKNRYSPINTPLKINISLERLEQKKEYLYSILYSYENQYIIHNQLEALNFIEKYNLVTPLILACKLKNIEIAAFLVKNGANWVFKDIHQKTAYDYAVENNLLANNKSTTELANAWYKYFIYKQVSFKEDKHLKFWNSLKISNKLKLLDICIKRTIKYYEHPQQLSEGEK